MKMTVYVLSGLLLILLVSNTQGTYSWCKDCGPLQLEGPINGEQPTPTSMPVIQANCSGPVIVTCQMTLTNNMANFSNYTYNPRLQMFLTANGQQCTLRPSGGCDGIMYTYNKEEIDSRTMTFSYLFDQIPGLHNSVVSCGVQYVRDSSSCTGNSCLTHCFAESAALIKLQDDCIATEPPTTEMTTVSTTVPPTTETTESPTKTTTTESTTHTTTGLPTETSTTVPPTDTTTPLATMTTEGLPTVLPAVRGEIVVSVTAILSLVLMVSLICNVGLIYWAIRRRNCNTDKRNSNGFRNEAYLPE